MGEVVIEDVVVEYVALVPKEERGIEVAEAEEIGIALADLGL